MNEFKRGWAAILCGLVGVAASSTNINAYTIGLMGPELATAFGWKLSAIQAQHIWGTVALVITLPFVGYLTDRFGPRRIGILSALLLGTCLLLHTTLDGSLPRYYVLSILTSIGGAGTLAVTWSRMVTLWFVERRGLALGLMLLGTGLGGTLLKPYTAGLLKAFGWQGAYVGLALLPLLLTVPLCLFLFHAPKELAEGEEKKVHLDGATMPEAMRDWRFWALGLAMVPTAATIGAMISNMEVMLKSMQFERDQTVLLASFIGLSVIAGRLLGGYLLDRVNAGVVGASMIILMAGGCLLMANPPLGTVCALLVIMSVGLCSGVEFDAIAFMVGRLFGLRAYSKIYSAVLMFYFMAGAIGPWLLSLSREEFGAYAPALYGAAVGLLGAAALMIAIGYSRRPQFVPAHH